MSERYWVICFYDEAAGQASDFATLGEAQAACVGIGLCKQFRGKAQGRYADS